MAQPSKRADPRAGLPSTWRARKRARALIWPPVYCRYHLALARHAALHPGADDSQMTVSARVAAGPLCPVQIRVVRARAASPGAVPVKTRVARWVRVCCGHSVRRCGVVEKVLCPASGVALYRLCWYLH
jgi:hypothetical protein